MKWLWWQSPPTTQAPLIVTLTPAHLSQGKRKQPYACILALACNEQLGGIWCIQDREAWQFPDPYHRVRYPLSDQAQAVRAAFDSGETLDPCTLPLDCPPSGA